MVLNENDEVYVQENSDKIDIKSLNIEDVESSEDSSFDDHKAPFIIVLDNAHMMDSASWELYAAIRDECDRIAIILLMQTDGDGEFKIHQACRDKFDEVWHDSSM